MSEKEMTMNLLNIELIKVVSKHALLLQTPPKHSVLLLLLRADLPPAFLGRTRSVYGPRRNRCGTGEDPDPDAED